MSFLCFKPPVVSHLRVKSKIKFPIIAQSKGSQRVGYNPKDLVRTRLYLVKPVVSKFSTFIIFEFLLFVDIYYLKNLI